jgi:transcriptional regulator with XRE-family HTH domain
MMENYSWSKLLRMTKFNGRLKLLREARNMTQVRLAKLVGVDPKVYNRWERGFVMPKFEGIVKLADILQVSLDELVGRTAISNETKIRNYELHQLCQQADTFADADQQALIQILDGLVKKTQLSKMTEEKR